MSAYRIIPVAPPLYLIILVPPIRGFDHFISVWAHTGKPRFIVDTGPSVTADALLNALSKIECSAPDHILLTHIHMDHAGAIGDISAAFPGANVVCHEKAVPHLIDPEKLQAGTIQTLGDTGRAYGPIAPVPEDRLVDAARFTDKGITPVLTPGHAPHHVSFLTGNGILFAGEAGGVNIQFSRDSVYMRPATPPRFKLETTVDSIDRLIQVCPDTLCYSHIGIQPHAVELLKQHRDQLFFWHNVVADEVAKSQTDDLTDRCLKRLRTTDRLLSGLSRAAPDIFKREHFFIRNSIQGMIQYLIRDAADGAGSAGQPHIRD